jgi:hypothetical protein
VIRISAAFLNENPDAYIQLGSQRRAIEPGWHYGSRFPGDPARMVVYDFLPDTLLERVENRAEFLGALAFDQWMGNADCRQAIFFRARVKEWVPGAKTHPLRMGFVGQMVDHGYVFEGPHWRLTDSPLHGLYFRPLVYSEVRGLADFQPWLERILHFPDAVVDEAVKQIPAAWLEGEEEGTLARLLEALMRRTKRVPELIEACRRGRTNLFPEWR